MILCSLLTVYWTQVETIIGYGTVSQNLNNIPIAGFKGTLEQDIQTGLGQSHELALRISTLGGHVPFSKALIAAQVSTSSVGVNVVNVMDSILKADVHTVVYYHRIIELCEGRDYLTQDLCAKILINEKRRAREFRGFVLEYKTCLQSQIRNESMLIRNR